MSALSLCHHMDRYRGRFITQTWGFEVSGGGVGDVCSFLPTCVDISGFPVEGVPVKGIQSVKTHRSLHLHTLEVQHRYSTGGTDATPVV